MTVTAGGEVRVGVHRFRKARGGGSYVTGYTFVQDVHTAPDGTVVAPPGSALVRAEGRGFVLAVPAPGGAPVSLSASAARDEAAQGNMGLRWEPEGGGPDGGDAGPVA